MYQVHRNTASNLRWWFPLEQICRGSGHDFLGGGGDGLDAPQGVENKDKKEFICTLGMAGIESRRIAEQHLFRRFPAVSWPPLDHPWPRHIAQSLQTNPSPVPERSWCPSPLKNLERDPIVWGCWEEEEEQRLGTPWE